MKYGRIPFLKNWFLDKSDNFIGYFEGVVSIIINTALFALKYWVGISSASVAIIADAWHTLSDTLSSLIVLLGFKVSSKPPDRKHPFGHGRVEIISSLIIGILLGLIGINFLIESINRFIKHEAASFNVTAIIVFIISTVLKEAIALFSFWGGKMLQSRMLRAEGWHHRSDAIASLLILIGIFLGRYFWWIDGALGIIVSLIILYATYELLKDSFSYLIGEEPGEDFETLVKRLVSENVSENINIHHIHIHKYGKHKELTFHIELSPNMKLNVAHRIADELERNIKEKLNVETTIHVEPLEGKR